MMKNFPFNPLLRSLLLFCVVLSLQHISINTGLAQVTDPRPVPTLFDLDLTTKISGRHFWNLHEQMDEPAFATVIGIPSPEIKNRKIRKISFSDIGNDLDIEPDEASDYKRRRTRGRRNRIPDRIDTLPPEPTFFYSFNYEYDSNGRLIAADLMTKQSKEKEQLRREYYPDGKLRRSLLVRYEYVTNVPDTVVRQYNGYFLDYNKAGLIATKIDYNNYFTSHYSGYDKNSGRKPGHYLENHKKLTKTKYQYNSKNQLIDARTYLLPDSGQSGLPLFIKGIFYFYDNKGRLIQTLETNNLRYEKENSPAGAFVTASHFSYRKKNLYRKISEEFSFSSAIPDTLKLAMGKVAVDSSRLGQQGLYMPEDGYKMELNPYMKLMEEPDTVYFLKSGNTLKGYRNKYMRLDKKGRLDLAFNSEFGNQKRIYNSRFLESRKDNFRFGYECRFIWLNSRLQPEREVYVNRYSSQSDISYFPGDGFPAEEYDTLEELIQNKRITIIDQRYHYRPDGLPEKIALRGSYNREALRKVGESKPNPELTETLLRPCRPCEPCEKVKTVIREQPEWPYRSSAARVFSNFQYEFYEEVL